MDLSQLVDNTDNQNLSFAGTTLSISGGNAVNLSSLRDGTGTDNQTLSYTTESKQLRISGGNTVNLTPGILNFDIRDPNTEVLHRGATIVRINQTDFKATIGRIEDGVYEGQQLFLVNITSSPDPSIPFERTGNVRIPSPLLFQSFDVVHLVYLKGHLVHNLGI